MRHFHSLFVKLRLTWISVTKVDGLVVVVQYLPRRELRNWSGLVSFLLGSNESTNLHTREEIYWIVDAICHEPAWFLIMYIINMLIIFHSPPTLLYRFHNIHPRCDTAYSAVLFIYYKIQSSRLPEVFLSLNLSLSWMFHNFIWLLSSSFFQCILSNFSSVVLYKHCSFITVSQNVSV
jgi:hypothetical protein